MIYKSKYFEIEDLGYGLTIKKIDDKEEVFLQGDDYWDMCEMVDNWDESELDENGMDACLSNYF